MVLPTAAFAHQNRPFTYTEPTILLVRLPPST